MQRVSEFPPFLSTPPLFTLFKYIHSTRQAYNDEQSFPFATYIYIYCFYTAFPNLNGKASERFTNIYAKRDRLLETVHLSQVQKIS